VRLEPVAQNQEAAHRGLELLHVCDPLPTFVRNPNTRCHLRLVDIERSGALHDHIHHDLPLENDTIVAHQGPRKLTSLRSVLYRQQSRGPGEVPAPN